ncbi:MAG: CDP-glucose 4,6-dehydratase [Alphaproteobacteria bacterium]|nr:CDP-glucose 4,6-dehydratase [Alphaproteobacteria bacterium]
MTQFSGIYKGRRVFLTGHTGFKGSWLARWLSQMGAEVTGLALPPETTPNHFDLLKPGVKDIRKDIRDAEAVADAVKEAQPEIVFHLAAQPLVRRSYRDPLETWATNVMGTANVLDACRKIDSVRAIVVVTTDKCYENKEWVWGYRENDRLGGHDPYSASKAGVELVAASFRKSYFSEEGAPLLATARAGNVIGGGDWSEDRLIPDLARAVANKQPLVIRSPKATRPWQHVLEPLSGYLLLGQKLLEGDKKAATAWNFGPDDAGNQSVETVLNKIKSFWPAFDWQLDGAPQPHEATLLHLDSTLARQQLGWAPVWDLDECLKATAGWYRASIEEGKLLTDAQLKEYAAAAQAAGMGWAGAGDAAIRAVS